MEYRNQKYFSETVIDCEIKHPNHGWIPFSCDINDTGSDVDVISLFDTISKDPSTEPYKEPDIVQIKVAAAEEVDFERNRLLRTIVDPIAVNPLRWEELSESEKTELSTYRKALLDITEQEGYPLEVVWPEVPAWVF